MANCCASRWRISSTTRAPAMPLPITTKRLRLCAVIVAMVSLQRAILTSQYDHKQLLDRSNDHSDPWQRYEKSTLFLRREPSERERVTVSAQKNGKSSAPCCQSNNEAEKT